jgi:hypothetical protein
MFHDLLAPCKKQVPIPITPITSSNASFVHLPFTTTVEV